MCAVPPKYREGLDLEAVANVFPYGDVRFELQGKYNNILCFHNSGGKASNEQHLFFFNTSIQMEE